MSIVSESPHLMEVSIPFRYTFHFNMKYLSENVNSQMKTVYLGISFYSAFC